MLHKFNMAGINVVTEDTDLLEFSSDARRPVCRLRGKPVTPEQAFEIIRRTEASFKDIKEIKEHPDYIHAWNLWMSYFRRKMQDPKEGWVLTDGTVGLDFLPIDKYPEMEELLEGIPAVVKAFPYLDFVLVISDWDEMPKSVWDSFFHHREVEFEQEYWDENFYEAIRLGIWVHDGMIELLRSERAVWKYREYVEKYEDTDRKRYVHEYHGRTADPGLTKEYMYRCIRAYGMDPIKLQVG